MGKKLPRGWLKLVLGGVVVTYLIDHECVRLSFGSEAANPDKKSQAWRITVTVRSPFDASSKLKVRA
jgi:hypothetical protein